MKCAFCGAPVYAGTERCEYCGGIQPQHVEPKPVQPQQPIVINVYNSPEQQPVRERVVEKVVEKKVYVTRDSAPTRSEYSRGTVFLLCLFLGVIGVHRFYVGKTGTGILWLLTGGLCDIGWFFDLILIVFGGFRDKQGLKI